MEQILTNMKCEELDNIMKAYHDFQADKSDKKINLTIGVVINENNSIHYFDSIIQASKNVANQYLEKPYLLNLGTKDFCRFTQELIFGKDSIYMKQKRIFTMQTIGGTDAIAIAIIFLKQNGVKEVYLTDPPYDNHGLIAKYSGMTVNILRYVDNQNVCIDYHAFKTDLNNLNDGSFIILQVSGYNPCALDIDADHIDEICDIIINKKFIVLFDLAYQGFATANIDDDVLIIRKLQQKNFFFLVAQSFSKTMSLYGERAGALHIVCSSKQQRKNIFISCFMILRKRYTSPCLNTNRIITELYNNQTLKYQWINELSILSKEIQKRRIIFLEKLKIYQKKYNLNYNWDIYKNQNGLYLYLPILVKVLHILINDFHLYISNNGRINISAVHNGNVDYISESICASLSKLNQ